MRDNTRAGIVLIDGWLGAENREPAGWLMLREKAYTIQRSAKIAARAPGSNLFGVRSQALRLFLPHMQRPSLNNPLIPRQFGAWRRQESDEVKKTRKCPKRERPCVIGDRKSVV